MNQQILPGCALGLTSEDLSAWRDETLLAEEAARIATHSASCPACQERLGGFETIASALRTQRVPVPDERLWHSILATITTEGTAPHTSAIRDEKTIREVTDMGRSQSSAPQHPRRRLLGVIAAAAALALVVVGFGQLFHSGGDQRPQPQFSITWQRVVLPKDVGDGLKARITLAVSPADGSVAWLCQSGTQSSPAALHVWRTSDSGKSWQDAKAPDVTETLGCQIIPDQNSADGVALQLTTATVAIATGPASALYVTSDSGAHWRDVSTTIADLSPLKQYATRNGVIYALMVTGGQVRFRSSLDNWDTWTTIDDTPAAGKNFADEFWLNPTTGNLLVQTHSVIQSSTTLWTSDARGKNWVQLPNSPIGTVVARPTADQQHWNICSSVSVSISDPTALATTHVYCGQENADWVKRDAPNGTFMPLGIANDGALLAVVADQLDAHGQPSRSSFYRLPAESAQWQRGNVLPEPTAEYSPRPGGGQLWAMPPASSTSLTDAPVFTAKYPGPATLTLPTTTTSTPAGNVDKGTPLVWQPIAQPTEFQSRLLTTNIIAVAPSDGHTVYACAQPNADPPPTQMRGWVTHDGGASWTTLPLPQINGWCSLVVDSVNPQDVLLGVLTGPPPNFPSTYYHSTDGGQTWQHLSALDGSYIEQFATYKGTTYALRVTGTFDTIATQELQASSDGMTTWRGIDGEIHSEGSSVGQFWLDPYNGILLAANVAAPVPGVGVPDGSAHLWGSHDGGITWRSLQSPPTGYNTVLVQPPQPNHIWGICVADSTPSDKGLACGDISGQGWPTVPAVNSTSAGIGEAATVLYDAYTHDGAILAIFATQTTDGTPTYEVLRLPPNAQRWQDIGTTPEFSLLYAPTTSGDGELWSVPVNGIGTDAQGRIFSAPAP